MASVNKENPPKYTQQYRHAVSQWFPIPNKIGTENKSFPNKNDACCQIKVNCDKSKNEWGYGKRIVSKVPRRVNPTETT